MNEDNSQSAPDVLQDIAKSEVSADYARQSKVFRMFNPDKTMFIGFVNLSKNLSDKASLKATALAPIICSNGPPCVPGKTPESSNEETDLKMPFGVLIPNGFSKSFLIIMIPPLGPLSVL